LLLLFLFPRDDKMVLYPTRYARVSVLVFLLLYYWVVVVLIPRGERDEGVGLVLGTSC
jgi:hypothetical protein